MDSYTDKLLAPFPYFGGKALASKAIWSRFGVDIKNYIEPFFGSGAVLLNSPEGDFVKTVNDIDCFVANFWRSIEYNLEAVAVAAAHPVNECDLHARHQYLVDYRSTMTEKLKADPLWYDAMIAGWWAWGCSSWIGSGWCAEKKGVNKQLPHLGNRGRGVNKQLPHLGDRVKFLTEWFERLNHKLTDARICCGDWERICTVTTIQRFGTCAVLLDPPYGTTKAVYAMDDTDIAARVNQWCVTNGHERSLRIALCGHAGQHENLEELGWEVIHPDKRSGYQGADDRERIWFSPHCLKPQMHKQASLF